MEKLKKFIKNNKNKIIVGGLVIISGVVIITKIAMGLKKERDYLDYEGRELIKAFESDETLSDDIHMYDDMEFYELTHNADGSMNDYGKSLL